MRGCALTRFVDDAIFGWAYRLMYWPVEYAKRHGVVAKIAAVTIGWAWYVPVLFLVLAPICALGLIGAVWDMVSE